MSTTIAVSDDVRDQIKEFGSKGETYNEILARLIKSAKEMQLREILLDESDSTPIDKAISKSKKRWQ